MSNNTHGKPAYTRQDLNNGVASFVDASPSCRFRLGSGATPLKRKKTDDHASLSHPYLRRPDPRRGWRRRSALRLVPSHPRPRRLAVHRSARPLRPDPMRGRSGFAWVSRSREAAIGIRDPRRRPRPQAPRGHRKPGHADGPHRGLPARDRSAGARRRPAAAGVRRPALSGGHASPVSVPGSAAREATPEHHAARSSH